MGIRERLSRRRRSLLPRAEPSGGPAALGEALRGGARILSVEVSKPVERSGRRGLCVRARVAVEGLAGERLVLEASLHRAGGSPLAGRDGAYADSLGNLALFDVVPVQAEVSCLAYEAFFPFEAIEVERAGTLSCAARVAVAEADRGRLAEVEQPFELVAA
jgi:hypothetical protein